ncbi:MAG: hypothetical protein OHK005_04030 [Candidatus Methylacidiphilales bacterium]
MQVISLQETRIVCGDKPCVEGNESLTKGSVQGGSMAKGKELFLGLNQNGLILFIVLLFLCLPLCWIPWLIEDCKASKSLE